jgi:hypothetical protein
MLWASLAHFACTWTRHADALASGSGTSDSQCVLSKFEPIFCLEGTYHTSSDISSPHDDEKVKQTFSNIFLDTPNFQA